MTTVRLYMADGAMFVQNDCPGTADEARNQMAAAFADGTPLIAATADGWRVVNTAHVAYAEVTP